MKNRQELSHPTQMEQKINNKKKNSWASKIYPPLKGRMPNYCGTKKLKKKRVCALNRCRRLRIFQSINLFLLILLRFFPFFSLSTLIPYDLFVILVSGLFFRLSNNIYQSKGCKSTYFVFNLWFFLGNAHVYIRVFINNLTFSYDFRNRL